MIARNDEFPTVSNPAGNRLKRFREADVLIAVLPPLDFGSLHEPNIACVRVTLLRLASRLRSRFLIVEFAGDCQFGAAFLGCLVQVAAALRGRDRRLVVCADRWGVLRRARLDLLFPVLEDQTAALKWCDNMAETLAE